jgi:predicted transcriptional regulator
MPITLKPVTEAKLTQLAERTRRCKDEALEEALNQALAYHEIRHRKSADGAPQETGKNLEFNPVDIGGEPLSATILRERR